MKRVVLIACLLAAGNLLAAEKLDPKHELMVITPSDERNAFKLEGNEELFEKYTSPASTIKIALAAIGLQEEVITPDTSITCSDRTEQPAPMQLRQALEVSSNEYFEKLAEQIGAARLYDYFQRWGYPPVIEKPQPPDYKAIARGRVFSVTPQNQMYFMDRIATRTLDGISTGTYDSLAAALEQSELPGLHGKTGSDRHGSWFVAYKQNEIYVLRSDIPNSDGKRLKRILIDKLARDAKPKP